jgi:hypothetical protein
MKICIACAEEILEAAALCKHCGTMQNDERFKARDLSAPKHECNHPTLREWSDYFKNEPGLPKLEKILAEHGDERVVAYFYKAEPTLKRGAELLARNAFHESLHRAEMIFTDKNLIFADYSNPAFFEIYPLATINSITLDVELVDKRESLIFKFSRPGMVGIRSRFISLGKKEQQKMEAWRLYSNQLQQLSGHVLLLKGEDIITSTGSSFIGGIFFTQEF